MAPSKSPFATKTFKLSNASRSFKEGRLRSVKKVKKSSTGPVGGEIVFNLDLEDPEGAQEPIETNKNSTSLEDEEEIHSAADDDDDADIDTSYLSNALEASLKSSSSQRRKSYDHPSRGYQAAQRTMGTSRKMRNLLEISERDEKILYRMKKQFEEIDEHELVIESIPRPTGKRHLMPSE